MINSTIQRASAVVSGGDRREDTAVRISGSNMERLYSNNCRFMRNTLHKNRKLYQADRAPDDLYEGCGTQRCRRYTGMDSGEMMQQGLASWLYSTQWLSPFPHHHCCYYISLVLASKLRQLDSTISSCWTCWERWIYLENPPNWPALEDQNCLLY